MSPSTYQLYINYFRLGDDAWREKVRFYEDNTGNLESLYFEDRVEIEMDYLLCLFEIGRYEKYLDKIDPIVETVITENIYTYKGQNIFNELLFRKAACFFQLKQFESAKNILKHLINIDKNNPNYLGLYSICNRRISNDIYISIKATAMAALLIVIGITVARIFLEPFFDVYLQPFIVLRSGLILYAIFCLLGLELAFEYKIKRETGMFSFKLLNTIFDKSVK